jgi:hypothetical protein
MYLIVSNRHGANASIFDRWAATPLYSQKKIDSQKKASQPKDCSSILCHIVSYNHS